MNPGRPIASICRAGLGMAGLGAAGWAGYAAFTWLRYGRTRDDLGRVPLLDSVMPAAEVDECHSVRVHAPAEVTLESARMLDLQTSPLNAAIFAVRTIPARLRGEPVRAEASPGLLAETIALGWAMLVEEPGREIVMGAVTKAWEGQAVFTPLPLDEFVAFDEPGYAKIAWTLSAEPNGPAESTFSTRTRVVTTDEHARRRFRRYWAVFSPGILLIRLEALRLVKASAERAARQRAGRAVA